MAVSESKKRSNAKWDKENMGTVACRLKKAEVEAFRKRAASEGKAANAVLKEFVLQYIAKE
jgi:hypothetical protein